MINIVVFEKIFSPVSKPKNNQHCMFKVMFQKNIFAQYIHKQKSLMIKAFSYFS